MIFMVKKFIFLVRAVRFLIGLMKKVRKISWWWKRKRFWWVFNGG